MENLREIKLIWQKKFLEKKFRICFFASVITLLIILLTLAKFLSYNENRVGFSFKDPILSLFNPVDVTWITFAIIYASLLFILIYLTYNPVNFLIALQSYSIVALLRLITIFLLPLNAPSTIIPLKDPFVEFFGGGKTLLNDLFFSGHTATMFIFFLVVKSKSLKIIFMLATIFVGICVIIQHVHYTIDVLAAPFFVYTSYRVVVVLNRKLGFVIE
ncbi:MAG: sphingomyelin synthase family protein [Melioribacter sp.]|nr:sphingomyelin synthase family protein [Melioribacter sp.]